MKSRKSKKSKSTRPARARKAKPSTKPKKSTLKRAAARKLLPDPNDPREKALALMKKGVSQSAAAKSQGIATQRLARYRRATTTSRIKGRRWIIKDRRPAEMWIASNGRIYAVAVRYRNRSMVGEYWNAVNQFLITNDPSHLKPLQDKGIRDAQGKYHPWETGPNMLRKLDGIGELNFVEIYSQTAQ